MKPLKAPVFSSPEASMVSALKKIFNDISVGTRFRTEKEEPQIVVSLAGSDFRANGAQLLCAFNIRLAAVSYADVEELAEHLLANLPNHREAPFHWIEIESFPIFFEEDAVTLEQRLITVRALMAGL